MQERLSLRELSANTPTNSNPTDESASHSKAKGPTSLEEDKQLAERIRNGDERAFRELYRMHSPILLRRLVRWIGDTQHAEDCLQHVFLEAMRSIHRYRGEGSLRGWLNRITTHVVMDMFRQKKRWRTLMERIIPEQKAGTLRDSPALPEQLFLQEETRTLVHDMLEKLSPQKRMAILLCDLEGLALEEAAAQMNVPLGTVGSRLYHARRELQKRIQSELNRRNLTLEDLSHR